MTRTAPAAAPSTNGSPRRGTRVSPGPGRVPALDGLRGVAVLAVLAFHAWPVLFPGGFVGVDMFFVLSGFLITTGLVRRIDAGKGVGFGGFWMRRIRRLVPALVVALVGSTALAWLAFAEFPSGLRREWLGALTYSSNWLMIVDGNDYFNAATPPMFEHLWSLAIEEQFYVVWPPLILGLLLLLWPRGGTATAGRRVDMLRVGLVLLLAVASAVGMAIGQISGAPTTRMYFGTDTHAFGLLFGAAVSIWLAHVVHPAHPPAAAAGTTGTLTAPRSGPLRTLLVWAAFAVLVASFFVVDGTAPYVYLGVLAGLSALVAGLVFHVVQGDRQDAFSRAMSGRGLGWWGRRSYAAYLWHWPLLVIMRVLVPNDAAEWVEPLAAGGVLVLTALIAEASSRWIEEPILHRGFREAFSGWGRAVRRAWSTGGGKAAVAVGALLLVIVPVAAGAALLRSPSETKLQQEIAAAEDALRQAQAEQSTQPAPSADAADPDPESSSGSSGAQGSDAAAPAEPSGAAAQATEQGTGDESIVTPTFSKEELTTTLPASTLGEQVTLVGDSVALSAAPALLEQLPGLHMEAEVGHQLRDAATQLEELKKKDQLRHVTVIALGANGATRDEDWDRILETLGEDRLLVVVLPHGPTEWIPQVQEQMRKVAAEHPDQVVVADWDDAAQYVDEFAPDKVHPRGNGQKIFAQLVRVTIEERLGVE